MTTTNTTNMNIVLVHGAWADGSSWGGVIPILQKAGHRVIAVQLPEHSLADDVATVKRAINLVGAPVLLVGHSYGGEVITNAGYNNPNVKGLVYIAAFAPDAGESLLNSSPFRLTNISAVDGYFSINVIFPDKGSYQVITKITSQTHDVASLASFTVIVPATQSALNLFRGNYYYITWIGLLIASAVGVGSFLILKNKKNTIEYKD